MIHVLIFAHDLVCLVSSVSVMRQIDADGQELSVPEPAQTMVAEQADLSAPTANGTVAQRPAQRPPGWDWIRQIPSTPEETEYEGPRNVQGITRAHNDARYWHGSGPLCWDPCLAELAQRHTYEELEQGKLFRSVHPFASDENANGIPKDNPLDLAYRQLCRAESKEAGDKSAKAKECYNLEKLGVEATIGESLASGQEASDYIDADLSAEAVMSEWYDEEEKKFQPLYGDADRPEDRALRRKARNLSQLLWDGSQRLGCAAERGKGKGKKWFWTCLYVPGGNKEGDFDESVRPRQPELALEDAPSGGKEGSFEVCDGMEKFCAPEPPTEAVTPTPGVGIVIPTYGDEESE